MFANSPGEGLWALMSCLLWDKESQNITHSLLGSGGIKTCKKFKETGRASSLPQSSVLQTTKDICAEQKEMVTQCF